MKKKNAHHPAGESGCCEGVEGKRIKKKIEDDESDERASTLGTRVFPSSTGVHRVPLSEARGSKRKRTRPVHERRAQQQSFGFVSKKHNTSLVPGDKRRDRWHLVTVVTHRVEVAIVLLLREKFRELFNITNLHRIVERAARK